MADLTISKQTLDLRKVFRDKAPVLSKWMPGFFYNFMNRKLHIEELNGFLYDNRDKIGLDFVNACLDQIGISFNVIGLENIPKSGPCTLAANHPLGGPEGLGLMQIAGKVRTDMTFLTNDILMSVPNLKMLFTPVNKHGSNDHYRKLYSQAFQSDKMVLIFPAGMVSRMQEGKIRDLVWKSTFLTRAVKYERALIPVYIDGRNSNFFYNLARFRSKLGIKANLEMFLLSDEMFKHRGKTINITIGKPIDKAIFDDRMNFRKWSAVVKEYVYKLKDKPNLTFDEAYLSSVL